MLLLAVAAVALAGVSCNGEKSAKKGKSGRTVTIEKFVGADAAGVGRYNVRLSVNNGTRHNITITDGELWLRLGSTTVCTVHLDEAVALPKRSVTEVTLPLSLSIDSPMAVLSLYGRLTRGDADKITISLRATGRAGGQSRTIERKDIPLADVLAMFGADIKDVKKFLTI